MTMNEPLLIVPDFLDSEKCRELQTEYDARLAAGLFTPRGTTTTDAPLRLIAPNLEAELVSNIGQRMRSYFPHLPPLALDYGAYHRGFPGGSYPLHADGFKLDGSPNHTPNRIASVMVYLTEHTFDFDGGVIRFPRLGMEVCPRPGLLVGFLTTLDYQHEVDTITRGQRDGLAFWFQAAHSPIQPKG